MHNFFFLLLIIRGFFAFLFIPFALYLLQDTSIVEYIEFDLFLKRGFVPFSMNSFLICATFFMSVILWVYTFILLDNKYKYLNRNYFKIKNNIYSELAFILLILFLFTKIKLFFIPDYFDITNRDDLLFNNKSLFIMSQFFFPTLLLFAALSMLMMKNKKSKFDICLITLISLGSFFASINMQSRIFILLIAVMFSVFILKKIKNTRYKYSIILVSIITVFLIVFINSEYHFVGLMLESLGRNLGNKSNNISLTGLEQNLLNIFSRLDIYHVINSWYETGIPYDNDSNNKWARDTMIVHKADYKTKIGLPAFITFLPYALFWQDLLMLVFISFFVSLCFVTTYVASIRIGYLFCIAAMTFFCLSWPDKRLEPMIMTLLKVVIISFLPLFYSFFKNFCMKIYYYFKSKRLSKE